MIIKISLKRYLIIEHNVAHPLGWDSGNKKEENDESQHNGTSGLTDPSPLLTNLYIKVINTCLTLYIDLMQLKYYPVK